MPGESQASRHDIKTNWLTVVEALGRRFLLGPEETQFIKTRDTCRIATVGRDGWPHCVPVGYVYERNLFYIPSARTAKKVSNLRTNGLACLVIDDDNSRERGVMIQGRARIVRGRRFAMLGTWMESKTGWTMGSDTVMVVFKPFRKASWNLSKRSG